MKIILEIDHTICKEEITSWIEEVLIPNNPCVWGYSFKEHHCGSCHNSQLEKENEELKWQLNEVVKDNDYYQEENQRLNKENEELKEKLKGFESGNVCWQGDMDRTVEQNFKLKIQIEKMKCCSNCKHKFEPRKKGSYVMPCEATEYKPCDKWELAE